MKTLNQVLATIEDIADSHLQIRQYGYGNPSEIPSDVEYPLMWVMDDNADVNIEQKSLTKTFKVFFLDLLKSDNSNEAEIISDQEQIALDVLNQLQLPAYQDIFTVEPRGRIERTWEKIGEDSTAGCILTVSLRLDYLSNHCEVPSTLDPSSEVGCPGVTLYYGDSSIYTTVESGGTKIIDNFTLTHYDGTTSSKQYAASVASNQINRIYAYPAPSGVGTSYRTGDEYDIWTTVFLPAIQADPRGWHVRLVSFDTLAENNAFGNTNRFTDVLGTQSFATNYIIDHYTGLGWRRLNSGASTQAAMTWEQAIDWALSQNIEGFDDWFLPSSKQIESIYKYTATGSSGGMQHFPFNAPSANFFQTSTTDPNDTTQYFTASRNQPFTPSGFQLKTTSSASIRALFCRKHF